MIEVCGLTKSHREAAAVDQLTFEVPAAQVTEFLGPNGASMSTARRGIVGVDQPTAGTLTINDHGYTDHHALTEVGALLEARSLHPGRSACNHLPPPLAQDNGIGRSRVREVLERVGAERVARRRGKDSLGSTRRP